MSFIRLSLLLVALATVCLARTHTKHGSHRHIVESDDTEILTLQSALFTPEEEDGQIFAVLVAGSNGWYNYRHQADVAHAYHTLVNHGIKKDNIVTMMYDDVAKNKQNPYPGKLFNRPHGEDVYKDISIDYSGKSVTPENFINVLKGNKTGIRGGNKRVINSGSSDRVFIYFTDHGATGMVSFPDEIMSVKTLNDALLWLYKNDKYSQLVFYLEACESGSMFENVLRKDINVYAITAANAHESSWGTYCDNDMHLPCLGDLFSVNWMNDSDEEDLNAETLEKQFELVRTATNKSHVLQFGDLEIAKEPVAFFQGGKSLKKIVSLVDDSQYRVHWPSRDVELMHLLRLKQSTDDIYEKKLYSRKISTIHSDRKAIKSLVHDIVHDLVEDIVDRKILFEDRRPITQLQCHHEVVHAFDQICVDFNEYDYAMKYVYVLSNLCEELKDTDKIIRTLIDTCPDAFLST